MNVEYSLLLLSQLVALASAERVACNGLVDLCDLTINQVTFPGTHNSGSGFDGVLRYHSGIAASSCFYRNQGESFTGQLDFGIRYFDIDTCWSGTEAVNCHCGPVTCAYAGSVSKALHQVDTWMRNNTNEVVIIHFNRDVQEGYQKEIANNLESTLSILWDPESGGDLVMNTYYSVNRAWPTLRRAIADKQRIFIFLDSQLEFHVSQNWAHKSNSYIASTWAPNYLTSICSVITTNAESKCTSTKDFMELSGFGTLGLCTWDMATLCSKWLGEAQEECRNKRILNGGRTVNFLLVDWIHYHSGGESVVNKAKFMNQKNIEYYLDRDIYFPEMAGCSYHPGWFYSYCWRYCPSYGWCWVNEYCGEDEDICTQSELSCYDESSCGYLEQ